MRDLLLLVLLGAAAYLGYDDYSKRNALKAAQQEVERLNSERSAPGQQVSQRYLRPRPYVPPASTPPAWFQERLNQRSSLDDAVRHRQKDEDEHRATQYGSHASPTP